MNPAERTTLIRQLLASRDAETALAVAERAAGADAAAHAAILEAAGVETRSAQTASCWLAEAGRLRLEILGERRRGLLALKAALEKDPSNARAMAAYAAAEKNPESYPVLEPLLRQRAELLLRLCEEDPSLGPRAASAHRALATLCQAAGQLDRASACLELAARLDGAPAIAPSGTGARMDAAGASTASPSIPPAPKLPNAADVTAAADDVEPERRSDDAPALDVQELSADEMVALLDAAGDAPLDGDDGP